MVANYSHFTNYQLAAVHRLPMPIHFDTDAAGGINLATATTLRGEPPASRAVSRHADAHADRNTHSRCILVTRRARHGLITWRCHCQAGRQLSARRRSKEADDPASLSPDVEYGCTFLFSLSPLLKDRRYPSWLSCRLNHHWSMMKLAHRSPSIIAGALVLPALMFGTEDMSHTRSLSTPRTLIRASRTAMGSPSAPILHVPAG